MAGKTSHTLVGWADFQRAINQDLWPQINNAANGLVIALRLLAQTSKVKR